MSSTNSSMHEKALFEQGLGCVTWWGFSPADGMKTAADPQDILILGAGDARHFISALTGTSETCSSLDEMTVQSLIRS